MARVLDHSLSKITLADCMRFLSESVNKKVKPLVDGFGKFNLRNLIIDWNRRNQEMLSNVQHQGEAILSKGQEIIKDAHDKKGELISAVQDRGEQLLAKKKQVLTTVHHKGQEVIANIQNTGEQLIEDVVEGAKKKISVLTPDLKKPHFFRDGEQPVDALRRKRDADALQTLEALEEVMEDEARLEELNEVDTKMATEVEAHDAFPNYIKAVTKAPIKPLVDPEYYTLGELSHMLFRWVRKNLPFQGLIRRPSVTYV